MACCEYVKMFKDDIDLSLGVGWLLNNTCSRPSTDAWILDTERVQSAEQPESAAKIINLPYPGYFLFYTKSFLSRDRDV